MQTLLQDLRYSLRMLAKNPGFTTVAVFTLALGIGANTAIFSVVNSVLLRPLPYRQPEKLLLLAESRSQGDAAFQDSSYPDYVDWNRQQQSFESLAGYTGDGFTFAGSGEPEVLQGARVTANFFATLGIKPALGRDFVSGEDRPSGGARVVILSHEFWQQRFGSNPSVIGQAIRLEGDSYSVIGVLPHDFEFAPTNSPPVWVPLSPPPDMATRRNLRWMHVIGRLKPGVPLTQALAEMQAVNARLALAYPQENGAIHIVARTLREQIVGEVRPLLLVLLAAVGLVLLIACANVAHLLLARSAVRRREIAIRMALGAGRSVLLKQFLTESLLLALVGGTLGLLSAPWGVKLMVAAIPKPELEGMPYLGSVRTDPTVLAFAFLVAITAGILFGLAPALEMSRTDVNQNLKDESRGSAGSAASRLRDGLVVAELAFALVLVLGAGLLLKSVNALLHQDPGFRADNLLTFEIDLPQDSYKDDAAAVAFEQRFSERLRSLPGVQGVATVSKLPLTGNGNTVRFLVEGRPTAKGHEDESNIRTVTAGYFDVMKIPLIKGRPFAPTDKAGAPQAVLVNQAFARRYFSGGDLVGKRVRFTFSASQPFREIIGVVGDENADQLGSVMPPILYTPFLQDPDCGFDYVVRAAAKPENLITPIRRALQDEDAVLPMIEPQTMEQIIAQSPAVFLRLYPSYLIGSFAALAVVLALVGLYGLISFSVAQRAREIGIRMAVGAQSRDVVRLVLGHAIRLALLGVVAGVAVALAAVRLISSLLFGVSPADPAVFAAVGVLFTGVALVASYVPARRATKVDPLVALRCE